MSRPGAPLCRMPACSQGGITLVELMLASALGLLVILAAISLMLVSRNTYVTLDEQIAVQETGHYAMAILARSVRQASWSEWSPEESAAASYSSGLRGLDAKSLKMASEDIKNPVAAVSFGSDVLAVRFGGAADGSMLNCAGFAVSKADEDVQGWSIFFVGGERNAEPELRCKYRGKNSWRTEGIARGIESFQVLYGIDTSNDGLPNQFLNASRIEQLNADLDDEDEEGDYWSKVAAIKVAMLVRSHRNVHDAGSPPPYHLFDDTYSSQFGSADRGTFIREAEIPSHLRARFRKVFVITIPLRNHNGQSKG